MNAAFAALTARAFIPRRALALMGLAAAAFLALPVFAQGTGSVVTTPQVRAEVVAHAPEGIAPGKPLWLGLRIQHAPHWHTYWKNPGDSGLPTTLTWTLPTGLAAGDIEWPTPRKLPVGPLLNYGYEDDLLLAVPVQVAAAPSEGTAEIRLAAEWLVCKDVCIPESGEFVLQLPVQGSTAGHGALFDAARGQLPRPADGAQARAGFEGESLVVRVSGLPAALQGRTIEFLPETPGLIANAAPQQSRWEGADWIARIALDPQRADAPTAVPAVLLVAGDRAGWRVDTQVTGAWPAVAASPAPAPEMSPVNAPATGADPGGAPLSLPLALLFALVGGMLLNLMPCVFPVLSLKVLSFTAAGQGPRERVAGGVAYTVGVVASFVALAAVLLALRAGGEQLGWGFQLQNPYVVAALAALFALIAMNLSGAFEFGSVLPSSWASARARHPRVDDLLTGVLAVAVAAPCTAPFMGASLGLAVTLPTVQALLVFAVLGLGMALPYLLASAWPALAQRLPRPGPWMAHFKTLMAFPMWATVVWLVWVLGQQVGIDGVAALLGSLVALAFVAWALGSPTLGRQGRWGFGAVAAACLAATLTWAWPSLNPPPQSLASGTATASEAGWGAWSPERVAQAQGEGRTVFVDFTAAWCVTCQFNKRTVLTEASVVQAFESHNVVRLRADWTRRDPAITAELTRLGRSGVPVYALYPPGGGAPRLLSEILSVDEVRQAVASSKVAASR